MIVICCAKPVFNIQRKHTNRTRGKKSSKEIILVKKKSQQAKTLPIGKYEKYIVRAIIFDDGKPVTKYHQITYIEKINIYIHTHKHLTPRFFLSCRVEFFDALLKNK